MVTATLVSLLPYFSCRRLIRLLFFSRDMYQNIQQMFPELFYGRDKHPFVRRVYSRQCRSEGNHVQCGIFIEEQATFESCVNCFHSPKVTSAPASLNTARTVFAISLRADNIELRWLVSIRMIWSGFIFTEARFVDVSTSPGMS